MKKYQNFVDFSKRYLYNRFLKYARFLPFKVKVPFYHQQFDFTCGPASLMMCLAALKPGYAPSRDEELAIWREATLMEIYGTSRYGLALAAVRRGLKATVIGPPERCYIDTIGHLRPEVDFEMMKQFQADLRAKALAAGVEELPENLTMGHLEAALAAGGLPIALTSTALFDPAEGDIPHWVVISVLDEGTALAENPLCRTGETWRARAEVEAAPGYGAVSEGVVAYPLPVRLRPAPRHK